MYFESILCMCLLTFQMWRKANNVCTYWEKKIPSYKVGPEAKTATELYSSIDKQLVDYEMVRGC